MSNKPVIVVALLGGLGLWTPVLAGTTPPSKPSATTKKPTESHVAARRVATKTDPQDVGKTSLTEAQVDEVLKAKLPDVDSCWSRLPEDKRKTDTTAVLKLEIDDRGEVQTVNVSGPIPDETQRCIAVAASDWSFPETDVKVDAQFFEYPLALHAK